MLDMRDNMLAADLVRFGGANQDIMWSGVRRVGHGRRRRQRRRPTPTRRRASPRRTPTTPRSPCSAVGDSSGADRPALRRATTRPGRRRSRTPTRRRRLPDTFQVVPGRKFNFVAVAPGFGHRRLDRIVRGWRRGAVGPEPAAQPGLTVPRAVSPPGTESTIAQIVDDTEATNWASLDGVAGKQVTVDLAGDRAQPVKKVNVSALLRPEIEGDVDAGPQNAFSALRSFQILTCNANDPPTARRTAATGWCSPAPPTPSPVARSGRSPRR